MNRRLSGRSLLRDRPWHFAWLAGASALWWTSFELIDVRLGNWYYVMCLPTRALRWGAGALAFASVLPGIVETLELVENSGWWRSVRVRPLAWTRGKERAVIALGLLSFALPLVWPAVFFPLTWGSFALLLEPWNRRHARHSFLRDLEVGEAGAFCRTLVAGLVCGALWETWNYWARMKWIYTVPGFEGMKLFEMPLAGFLGFPPFAVECLVILRFMGGLRDRLSPAGAVRARWTAGLLGPPAMIGMFAVADPVLVDSVYMPLAGLDVIAPETRGRLASGGLVSAEQFLRATRDPEGRSALAARTGLAPAEVDAARARAALVAYRGLGLDRARQLEELGIRTLADLARWTPEALAAALAAQRPADPRNPFLERRARIWTSGLDAGATARAGR